MEAVTAVTIVTTLIQIMRFLRQFLRFHTTLILLILTFQISITLTLKPATMLHSAIAQT